MKSTTTVTTSSYYGNVNHNNNNISGQNVTTRQQSHQKQTIQNKQLTHFITPQEMLKRLIPYSNVQSVKQQQSQQSLSVRNINSSKINSQQNAHLIGEIQSLQSELNNIHAEIIQSENLLNVRDSLYGQLDMLREQRQLIQGDIAYLQSYNSQSKQVKISIKPKQGYKQMNQRLRRRMNEIREYIYKMELENKKIEDNINYSQMVENSYNQLRQQSVMAMTMGNNHQRHAWVDNSYYHGARENSLGRVDELITRLHHKQEEALEKVRRQQEEINRRNNLNRASFAASNHISNNTFYQGRTYYPQSEIGNVNGRAARFYSPQYRY